MFSPVAILELLDVRNRFDNDPVLVNADSYGAEWMTVAERFIYAISTHIADIISASQGYQNRALTSSSLPLEMVG